MTGLCGGVEKEDEEDEWIERRNPRNGRASPGRGHQALFSELGYDATTQEMIANTAGLQGTRSDLMESGKHEIYLAVFERCYAVEKICFEEAAERISYDAVGLHQLADVFLDFVVAHPELRALWGHRVLKDAADLRFPEESFTPHLEIMMTSHEWAGTRQNLDLQFVAWTIIWMTIGFVGSGLPDEHHSCRHRADHSATLRYFRVRLHELLDWCIRA